MCGSCFIPTMKPVILVVMAHKTLDRDGSSLGMQLFNQTYVVFSPKVQIDLISAHADGSK